MLLHFHQIMYSLRIVSITAASTTLIISIAAVTIASFHERNQYQEMRRNYHVFPWYALLDLAVTFVATIGFSISLLVYSIFWNEKWIEILLLMFGRFLLIKQVSIYLCYRFYTN